MARAWPVRAPAGVAARGRRRTLLPPPRPAPPGPLDPPQPAPLPAAPLVCSVVESGRAFEARAAQVLALARDGVSFSTCIQVAELEPMLATAERLGLRVSRPCGALVAHGRGKGQRAQRVGVRATPHAAPGRPGSCLPLCPPHTRTALISTRFPSQRHQPLAPQLESLPILRGMLAGFRHWEAGARAITQASGAAPV